MTFYLIVFMYAVDIYLHTSFFPPLQDLPSTTPIPPIPGVAPRPMSPLTAPPISIGEVTLASRTNLTPSRVR